MTHKIKFKGRTRLVPRWWYTTAMTYVYIELVILAYVISRRVRLKFGACDLSDWQQESLGMLWSLGTLVPKLN